MPVVIPEDLIPLCPVPTEGDVRCAWFATVHESVLYEGTSAMPIESYSIEDWSLNVRHFIYCGAFTDEELLAALSQCAMSSFVEEHAEGLQRPLEGGGSNMSAGQRQLCCMARALLKQSKVLVLDEATANLDAATDELIQTTTLRALGEATVLTIAHRLNTIMDSNRVMVLDQGNIAEFDSPDNLLDNKETIFYSMAKNAGIVA